MKKIWLILTFTLFIVPYSFCQLTEVKGVETKTSIYDGPGYDLKYNVIDDGKVQFLNSYQTKRFFDWFGFSFTNRNNFSVTIEAELIRGESIIGTKSFVLDSGESYIWKNDNNNSFRCYRVAFKEFTCNGEQYLGEHYHSLKKTNSPYAYVKFKAFKLD